MNDNPNIQESESQCKRILAYLLNGSRITSLEALRLFDYDGYNCSLYNSSRYPCTVVKGTKSSYTQVGVLSPGEMMDFVNIKGGWVLKNFTRYSTKE